MLTCTFEDGGKANLRHVVVHGIIEKQGKILLVKRANGLLESGKWGIISGFLNQNETAETGVIREVKEETGWDCEVLKLFRINTNPVRPNDRNRQSVAIEFILRPIKQTGYPDRESSKVEWIPVEKLFPFTEFAFDHGQTINLFRKYLKKPFLLPLFV